MRHCSFLVLVLLAVSSAVFGQTSSTDSKTLQDLLAEVRQLRQDLQTTTVAVQRAQILLYRIQTQEGVVTRVAQRLDEARSQLAQVRHEQKQMAEQIKYAEDSLSHGGSATDRKEIEEQLPKMHARLDALGFDEQQRQAKELDAQQQLRIEESKLADLQSQLDRLDMELQNVVRQAPRSPR